MKMKKILASAAASALAVSAMSVCALASEPVKKPESYEKPPMLIGADTTVPDAIYAAGVEVTFNLTVNDVNGGWANGSAGIIADGSILNETKFGGTECDAEGNRSWFPEGSVVITEGQKTATVVCKSDLTGKSGFNLFIFSGQPSDAEDNGFFTLDSVTIKNEAGFEATYADGKLTVAGGAEGDSAATADTDTSAADFKATLGGQLNSDFNATIGEWPADAEAYGNYTKEVTITWDFGAEKVKLAGNYLGIKTNVPFHTEEGVPNAVATVSSIKADDRDVTFDSTKVFIGDNDSEAGTMKITLMNEWDSNVQGNPAVDFNAVNGDDGFSKLSITFTIGEIPAAAPQTEAPATEAPTTEAPATEAPATEAPTTEAPATEATTTEAPATAAANVADTNNAPASDKGNADTGVEGVAIVAALAVLAGGAVVIAKKRK